MTSGGRRRGGPYLVLTVALTGPRRAAALLLAAATALLAAAALLAPWMALSSAQRGVPGRPPAGSAPPAWAAWVLPLLADHVARPAREPQGPVLDHCDPPGWPDPSLYGAFTEDQAPWAGDAPASRRLAQHRRAAPAPRWLAGFRVTAREPLFEETANLRLAAGLLAGTVVQPGAVFSMNATLGPYTGDRGYRPGPSYVGGRLVPSDGGGICKVATALYNAAVHGGLTVLERHAHSMMVPYVAPGRDAAVVYGAKDFRFRNDTGFPVLIWSDFREPSLFVALYGGHDPPQVTWHQQVLARQEPWTLRSFNPELGPGEERVVHEGYPGFTVRTWLTVTRPGHEPERRDLGVDTYLPLPRVVEHGP